MDSLSGVGVIDKSVAILEALAELGAGVARGAGRRDRLCPGRRRTGSRSRWRRTGSSAATSRAGSGSGCGSRRGAGRRRRRPAGCSSTRPRCSRTCATQTGESAQLYVRDGDHRVCVAAAERPAGLRDTVPIGARLSLVAGSGAKVLLAWADPTDWPSGADGGALRTVRTRGWAASVAEREAGVASVSAPVRDGSGAVVAALSVSGPIDRLGRRPGRPVRGPGRPQRGDLSRRAF